MLKLINNVTPTGTINGINKVFSFDKIIGSIQIVTVDGNEVKGYTFNNNQITLDVAPDTSIVVSYFYSEVSAVKGTGEVTLGDLATLFYRKIGRINQDGSIPQNITRLYPLDYVEDELVQSIKRISNISPEKNRIQQYTIHGQTGSQVLSTDPVENSVTFESSLNTAIEGIVMTGNSVVYNYYSKDTDGTYQVADVNLAESGDDLLYGFRIPYGIKDIVDIKMDNNTIEYVDEMDFTIKSTCNYTITRDWQGNDHIFLPYTEDVVTTIVKYIPDITLSKNEDIIDIPSEYAALFVYDVAYRLLRDREDDRWSVFRDEVGTGAKNGLLYEYQSYVKSKIKRPRARVGFAKTN